MSEIELKPCPFCGSSGDELGVCYETGQTPALARDWYVRCYGCHVETTREESEPEAIAIWNRRTQEGGAEPMAWQVRSKRLDGSWSEWRGVPDERTLQSYRSQSRAHEDIELRPLFASVPSETGWDEAVSKCISSLNTRAVVLQDRVSRHPDEFARTEPKIMEIERCISILKSLKRAEASKTTGDEDRSFAASIEALAKLPDSIISHFVRILNQWGDECCGGAGREIAKSGPSAGEPYGKVYYDAAKALSALSAKAKPERSI